MNSGTKMFTFGQGTELSVKPHRGWWMLSYLSTWAQGQISHFMYFMTVSAWRGQKNTAKIIMFLFAPNPLPLVNEIPGEIGLGSSETHVWFLY